MAAHQSPDRLLAQQPERQRPAIRRLERNFDLQDKYGFVIASDECYSEIYFDGNKPIGGLQAAAQLGRGTATLLCSPACPNAQCPRFAFRLCRRRCRVAQNFLLYRTYHGSAMSISRPTRQHCRLER